VKTSYPSDRITSLRGNEASPNISLPSVVRRSARVERRGAAYGGSLGLVEAGYADVLESGSCSRNSIGDGSTDRESSDDGEDEDSLPRGRRRQRLS
jgi:hypothetical protein